MELKIEKDRVLHLAKKDACLRPVLMELFPEAFEKEPYFFGDNNEFSRSVKGDFPFFIADGMARKPSHIGCALVVTHTFRAEFVKNYYDGQDAILFFKK